MKINTNKYSDVDIISTTNVNKIKLSKDYEAMFFNFFTKNIYSNPIGSIVREITSNCFDSHIEAGVNKPVVIKLSYDKQSNLHHISFIDFGVGMSPDRIDNTFSVMFTSTKRETNSQIGGFGLGSKTPLAYKRKIGEGTKEYDNSYYIITIFNNIKYIYMIHDGNESPEISLLHKEQTDEENGTEVRIPVLEHDISTFASQIKKQLYYFENLVFEGFENYSDVTNDYTIYNAKSFLYRGSGVSRNAHVCLGRVAYPIDYSTIGLSSYDYNIPIAIKFNIGELNVTANRETLDYSEETINLIKERLNIAMFELKELATKQYQNVTTLEDYFNFVENFGEITLATKNVTQSDGSIIKTNITINVRDIVNVNDIELKNFKYKNIKIPTSDKLFHYLFTYKTYGKKPSTCSWGTNKTLNGSFKGLQAGRSFYYIDDEFNRKVMKQSYLAYTHTTYFIIQKLDLYYKNVIHDLIYHFNLDNFNFNEIIDDEGNIIEKKVYKKLKLYFELQEDYFKIIKRYSLGHYDDVVVPDDFIAEKKRKKAIINPDTQINVRFVGRNREKVPLKELYDANFLMFYGTSDDEYQLAKSKRIYEVVFNDEAMIYYFSGEFRRYWNDERKSKSVIFIQVAKSNVRYLKDIKNAYHISQFTHKLLRRKIDMITTYFGIANIFQSYMILPDLFKNDDKLIKIRPQLARIVKDVNNYLEMSDIKSIVRKDEIKYHKDIIANELKINPDDVQKTPEQIKFANNVKTLVQSHEKNKDVLSFINIPYHIDGWNDTFVNLLRKVMVF